MNVKNNVTKKDVIYTRRMECDGCFSTVLSWRSVGCVEADNLAWRFITEKGATAVVRPVQIPSNARPFCVPSQINSALRAVHSVAECVHDANLEETKRYEHENEQGLWAINEFIGMTIGKRPVAVPHRGIDGFYSALQQRKVVERLTDLSNDGARKLKAIRDFILHELFKNLGHCVAEELDRKSVTREPKIYPPSGIPGNANIKEAQLRQLVTFIGKQLGRDDMVLLTLMAYNDAMPAMLKGWIAETAKTRNLKPGEARAFLINRVTFVAECEGERFWHCYPIEDITPESDVRDQEDRAPHQLPIRQEILNSTGGIFPHGNYEKIKTVKSGRPIDTDRKYDESILKQWEFRKRGATRLNYAEFAQEKGIKVSELIAAIDRARKRRQRQRIALSN